MKQIRNHSNSLLPFFAITLALCIFTLALLPATANAFPRPIRTMEIVMPGDSDPDTPYGYTDGTSRDPVAQKDDLFGLYVIPIMSVLNLVI